jgi:hypothetical protein
MVFSLFWFAAGCSLMGKAKIREELNIDATIIMDSLSDNLHRELTFDNDVTKQEEEDETEVSLNMYSEMDEVFAPDEEFALAFERFVASTALDDLSEDETELITSVMSAYTAYTVYYLKVMEKMLFDMLGLEGDSITDLNVAATDDNDEDGLFFEQYENVLDDFERMQQMSMDEVILEFDRLNMEIRLLLE